MNWNRLCWANGKIDRPGVSGLSLADESNGLTVRDLAFSRGNRRDMPVERWDGEFTLTQLIFSPTTR